MELTPARRTNPVFTAALLAERRKAKGLKLNYPEAVASSARRSWKCAKAAACRS
jgi:urease gamma subunit